MLRIQDSPTACIQQKIKLDVCNCLFLLYLYTMWSGEVMDIDNINLF